MSTFIATLGFDAQSAYLHSAKSSILVASLLSAILDLLYFRFIAAKKHNRSVDLTSNSGENEFRHDATQPQQSLPSKKTGD